MNELLPFEKKRILYYHLYFDGIAKAMILQGENKQAVLQYVGQEVQKRGIKTTLLDVKLTTPIFGITEQTIDGVVYVYCGFDHSPDGFMEKSKFLSLNKIKI